MTKILATIALVSMTACWPSPSKESLNPKRHFNEYVIEANIIDENDKPIKGAVTAVVKASHTDDAETQEINRRTNGSYYVVLPEDYKRANVESIVFSIEGYQDETVAFDTYEITEYTPDAKTVEKLNAPDLCDEQQLLGDDAVEFGFRLGNPFVATAYASSYTYKCTITYRARDKITVVAKK